MKKSYEIPKFEVDGKGVTGEAKFVWLYLPEKILVVLLTFMPFFKGMTLAESGFHIVRGTENVNLGASIGWGRMIVGVLLALSCSYVWVRLFDKGTMIIQFKRFADNIIQFPRGGKPKQ